MIALLGLGLAAGTLDFSSPIQTATPTAPGRVVFAASPAGARPPREAGADLAPSFVLALGPSPGTHDVAGAAVSGAADAELAAAIDAAPRIELQAGTWLGWYQASQTHRHDRAWTRALLRAHAAGKEVRASGAAAAWIARWSTVARAVLEKPAQDPHDFSLDLPVEGLGLLDGPLVGVLELGASTADRIVERAVTFHYPSVLLLAGDVEVDCDPRARTARIRQHGQGIVLWIDLAAGTRSRERIRGARVTLPRDGDVLDLWSGALARVAAEPVVLDAETATLIERLLVGDRTTPTSDPLEMRNVRTSRDERTLQSALGGLQGIRLDFEIARDGPR